MTSLGKTFLNSLESMSSPDGESKENDSFNAIDELNLIQKEHDHVQLADNSNFGKMLKRYGDNFPFPEKLLYSRTINRKGKEQERVFVATDKAIYNLSTSDWRKPKRRIDYDTVASVSVSTTSSEFALHVPSEYDYRYRSPHRDELVQILRKIFKKTQGTKLKVAKTYQSNLDEVVWTRKVAELQSREQKLLRYKKLVSQPAESDDEETRDFGDISDLKDFRSFAIQSAVDSAKKPLICEPKDFELLKVIGRGSFGKVILVKKKDNDKLYAMKVLKKRRVVAQHQIEHTKAERRILASLTHPFCMTLRYAFQTSSKLYLVLDFFRGGELFFHLKRKRRFTVPEAQIIVAEVALALGHLHSLDIVYRDLKPENILMDLTGHVCITDFGLSKELEVNTNCDEGGHSPKGTAMTHTFCGTPEYLAPEIVKHAGHGIMVDWWTLGVLSYELMVGIPPFYSKNVNDMYEKIQFAKLLFPLRFPAMVQNFISGLLQRDPSKRLGAQNDLADIKIQRWFHSIDWEKMMRREIEPVYKPKEMDAKVYEDPTLLFEKQFTTESIRESDASDVQVNFGSFEYKFEEDSAKSPEIEVMVEIEEMMRRFPKPPLKGDDMKH